MHPPLWLTLTLCGLALAARKPDMIHRPQFWAEDGFFFACAYGDGLKTLLQPYAGYLHLVPRLVALLAAAAPPAFAPALFVGCAFLGTLYVAARTQSRRAPFAGRLAAALAVVLVPDAFEVLLNITNLQWVIASGLLLVLVSADPEKPIEWMHDIAATFVLGLTGPFSTVLAPLFLARAVRSRTAAGWVLFALVTVCGALQAWMIVTHPQPVATAAIRTPYLLAAPGMRIAGSLFIGNGVPEDYSFAIEVALTVFTGALVVALSWRRTAGRTASALAGTAFFLLLTSALYRCRFVLPELCHHGFGARYFYPLQMIVLWLLVLSTMDARRWVARLSTAALLLALAMNAPRLREPALPDEHWARYVPRIERGEALVIPINPPGWTLTLPARR
jgi:hypothetical protein